MAEKKLNLLDTTIVIGMVVAAAILGGFVAASLLRGESPVTRQTAYTLTEAAEGGEAVAEAAEAGPDTAGTLVAFTGQVTVRHATGLVKMLTPGQAEAIGAGDLISLDDEASGQLTLNGGSRIDLFDGTVIGLKELQLDGDGPYRVSLDLLAGRTFSRVQHLIGPDDTFMIATASAVASVRGTEFGTEVLDDGSSYVHTEEGTVSVSVDGQEVEVNEDEGVHAQRGQHPEVHPHGQMLAEQLGVPYDEVMGWFEQGYGFGQIQHFYNLSEETGLPPAQMFEAGVPLGVMKQLERLSEEHGVALDELIAMYESGMKLGEIKQGFMPEERDNSGQGNNGQDNNGQGRPDDDEDDIDDTEAEGDDADAEGDVDTDTNDADDADDTDAEGDVDKGANPEADGEDDGEEAEPDIPPGIMRQLEGISADYEVPLEDVVAMYESGMNLSQIRGELEN